MNAQLLGHVALSLGAVLLYRLKFGARTLVLFVCAGLGFYRDCAAYGDLALKRRDSPGTA